MTKVTLYKDGERLIATDGKRVVAIERVDGQLMRNFGVWSGNFKTYVAYRKASGLPTLQEVYVGFATQVPRTCDNLAKFINERRLI